VLRETGFGLTPRRRARPPATPPCDRSGAPRPRAGPPGAKARPLRRRDGSGRATVVNELTIRRQVGREPNDPKSSGVRKAVTSLIEAPCSVRTSSASGTNRPPSGLKPGRRPPPAGRWLVPDGIAVPRVPARHEPRVGDGLASATPASVRGHRERHVLGEHGEDAGRISALQGIAETFHEPLNLLVAERACRRLLAPIGDPLLDGSAGALEGAVHRGIRRSERLGHLRGGEGEHLPQDQHGALTRWQMLERGEERELQGLALLVSGLRDGVPVRELELLVRVRIDPVIHELFGLRPHVRRGGGGSFIVDRQHPLRPPADSVETDVGRDPIQPRPESAPAVEPGQPSLRPEHGVLEHVFGVVERAEHPVAVGMELRSVRGDEAPKRLLIAAASRSQQFRLLDRRSHRHLTRSDSRSEANSSVADQSEGSRRV